MIIDTFDHAAFYESLHPQFKKVFDFLRTTDLSALSEGKHELSDDGSVYASVQTYQTKPVERGKMEAHRKFIDIQVLAYGEEMIGWAPLANQPETVPFDINNDIGFYESEFSPLFLKQNMFAIFFPQDAHMPCRTSKIPNKVKKIVFKIAV